MEPTVRNTVDKNAKVLSPVTSTEFEVVLQEEFMPSYDWQEVQPWQSVPPGLEVQLPLDGVTHKRARIPPAWRLQLYVPGGEESGGFFVRTDLRPDSTVLDLRQEIARKSRVELPLERVKLTLGARTLEDDETANSLNLFNRQRELVAVVERGPNAV